MSTRITKTEVLQIINNIPQSKHNAVVCALVGHSRIVNSCFGQITCGRCDAIVGDTLAGAMDLKEHVIIGHGCDTCRKNYKNMGWRDKLFAPDPELGEE